VLPESKLLTPAEHLAIEREAEFKSEYLDGKIYSMANTGMRHNLIAANVIRLLGNQLLERNGHVYPSDMRVKIEAIGKYTYPDVAVVCGDRQFEDDHADVLLNPQLIIEILSPTTEAHDRGKKFEHYQALDSLQTFVLISQESSRVEVYERQDVRTWTYQDFHDPEVLAPLLAIGCELRLAELYAKVL